MGIKKIGTLLFCILLIQITFVMAVKPAPQTNTAGLQIFYPQIDSLKQNSNYYFHVHTANITTGEHIPNDEVSCKVHFYNKSGSHIFESPVLEKDPNNEDHEITIDGGNFSVHGDYSFILFCNTSASGGEVKGFFTVTTNGHTEPSGIVIVAYSFFFLLIVGLLLTLVIYNIGKFVEKDFNLTHLILNFSAYFMMFAYYGLSYHYLGSEFIEDLMPWILASTAVTNILIPAVIFIIAITAWKWQEAEKWF